MKAETPQQGNMGIKTMSPTHVDPQEFGRMQQKIDDIYVMVTDIHTGGSHVALANRINLRWVWSAVCGLAAAFGAGFAFLYHRSANGG